MYQQEISIFTATWLCIILSAILLQKYRWYDDAPRHVKTRPLDGLRGILASFVLTAHFYLTFIWKTTGVWNHDNLILANHGAIPVHLFFLITGFLFIGKIRQPDISWKKLYLSRIRRIAPLYYAAIIPVIIATVHYNFTHEQNWRRFLGWLKNWLIFRGNSFEEFHSWIVLAGVQWTLLYEWAFYCSLPVIWWLWHRKKLRPMAIILVSLITLYIMRRTDLRHYQLFIAALPAVWLAKQNFTRLMHYRRWIDATMLCGFIALFWVSTPGSYPQIICLAVFMIFLTQGFDCFGLLTKHGLCILGDISYSIYLLHGLVLYALFTVWDIYDFSQANFYEFLLFLPLTFALTILLSLTTYHFIERPFLRKKN